MRIFFPVPFLRDFWLFVSSFYYPPQCICFLILFLMCFQFLFLASCLQTSYLFRSCVTRGITPTSHLFFPLSFQSCFFLKHCQFGICDFFVVVVACFVLFLSCSLRSIMHWMWWKVLCETSCTETSRSQKFTTRYLSIWPLGASRLVSV